MQTYGRKRARSAAGGAAGGSVSPGPGARNLAVRRAIAINARERRDWPRRDFGYAHFKRGAAITRHMFGPSYKEANATQRAARGQLGYIGKGMYTSGGYAPAPMMVETNSLIDDGVYAAPAVPQFAGRKDGGVVTISHREYISDVYAPGTAGVALAFGNVSYQINPGLEKTFPWLSQIAANYEEYTLKQCIFTFRSTVADFAANSGQIGQVVMATQYNAASAPFTDKRTMMEYDAAMSCKTSETLLHGVECDHAKLSGSRGRFIRATPVEVNQDINQYDHGQFNIAVADAPGTYAGQSMGELWVTYTVELRKPRFWTAKGLSISRDLFSNQSSWTLKTPLGLAGDQLFKAQQNTVGCVVKRPLSESDVSLVSDGALFTQLNAYAGGSVPPAPLPTDVVPCCRIVFPNDYAGPVRLLFTAIGSGESVDGVQTGWATFAKGNLRAIQDLSSISGFNGTNCAYTGVNVRDGLAIGGVFVIDVEVDLPSSGVANELIIAYDPDVATPMSTAGGALEILEYNYGLSVAQDGSNDAPYLVPA